jgi:hypothetical protein
MFGVGVGVRVGGFTPVSSGGGFDPDAQAFFDRVTTAGGTLSETEKNATNQLVLDMKSAGIWSSMKAIYPMVGASAAACAQNLKSSSFTGTFSSGWTFASTGVTGNGASTYFDTNCNASTAVAQNSTHLSYYCRTSNLQNVVDMGVSQTSIQVFGSLCYYAINSSSYSSSSVGSSGFFNGTRSNSTETKLFRNGSNLMTNTITSVAATNATFYLGAWNNSPQYNTSREYAFASIGDGLTDTQAANFYTAVQAFQTTLSRNV